MRKIVFATNNKHKLEEVRAIMGAHFDILSLSDINCIEDIPENGDTFEANAMEKAKYGFKDVGKKVAYILSCIFEER